MKAKYINSARPATPNFYSMPQAVVDQGESILSFTPATYFPTLQDSNVKVNGILCLKILVKILQTKM